MSADALPAPALPPLPAHDLYVDAFGELNPTDGRTFVMGNFYTAEQMQDYARAALSSNQAATDKESLTVAPVALGGEPPCNPHPDAPHGYNRNASHNAGRYVCDCEGWAALGGEKGEAVADELETAWNALPDALRLRPELNRVYEAIQSALAAKDFKAPLFAGPVGKARMLTDEEADHITGMHNTGRSQGDSECAEAIQRKFCEVNGITLEAK